MVYLFLAEGYEEAEALIPADILRRGGVEVKIVGIGSKTVKNKRGISINADICENEVDFDKIDMIILPGGLPGVTNLDASETVNRAISYCTKKGKYIAAICAAPVILAKRGLLENKKAICYPDMTNELCGAHVTDENVVCDGIFITSKAAGTAYDFGLFLLEKLKGKDLSEQVKNSIYYK